MCSIHCDENFELSLTYKLKWWYLINSFLFLPILSFSFLLIPFLPIHSYSFRFLSIPTLCISSYVFLPNTFRNLLIPTETFLFLPKPPYFFQFCPFPSYVFLLLPNHISCKEVLATKYLAWVSVIVDMAGVIWLCPKGPRQRDEECGDWCPHGAGSWFLVPRWCWRPLTTASVRDSGCERTESPVPHCRPRAVRYKTNVALGQGSAGGLWTWREGHSTGHTSHITPRFLITGAVSAVSAALWPSDLFWKFHNFLQHPSFCVTSYHERKEGQIALYCQILPIAVTKLSEERTRVVPSYFVLYCWDNWFKIWECI